MGTLLFLARLLLRGRCMTTPPRAPAPPGGAVWVIPGTALTLVAGALLVGCPGEIAGPGAGPADDGPPTAPGLDEPRLDEPPPVSACQDVPPDPGPSLIRRLTRDELARTIQVALGVDAADLVAALPPDTRAEGFTNNAGTLIVSDQTAEGYMTLAAGVAARVDGLDGLIDRFTDCRRLEPECTTPFVEGTATLLFRRPPAAEQVAAYAAIFDAVAAEDEGFTVGARLVVEALLQSPWFLYRAEPLPSGGAATAPVDQPALATRLAFLAWGAAPDDELLAAADAERLSDPDERERHVRRLLGTPRARAHLRRFVTDWFDLEHLDAVNLDDPRYDVFTPRLAREMRDETLRFVDHLVWTADRPLVGMYTEPTTFLTDGLAELYGLDAPGGDEPVDLSDVPERVGILTHPSVLAAHAFGEEPSLVSRGLFVLHDVLCDSVGSPPPGVDTTPPPTAPGDSHRDQSEDRVDNEVCGQCHEVFDPLGYPFDVFDAVGRHRSEDSHGNPVRGDGVFRAPDGSQTAYDDVAAFAELIDQSPRARQCITRKGLQFALGRPLVEADACTVAQVHDDFTERGGRYADLLVAIARHPSFVLARTEADEGGAP